MNKPMLSLMATGLALALASPASAVVTVCQSPNCAPTDENVLITSTNHSAQVAVFGSTNQSHTGVTFAAPLGETLVGDANGQADVSASDGLLNSLRFTLDSGFTFGSAVFNLFPLPGNQLNEASSVILSWFVNPNVQQQATFAINTNGQNDFGIFGTAGERFTAVQFIANPTTTGISDMRQLRLGDIRDPEGGVINPTLGGVPEPATWALMMVGFGMIGVGMRRKQRVPALRTSLTF